MKKRVELPEHLSAIWDEVVKSVVPRIGAAGMEALCGQIHRQREAEKRISEEGLVVQDAKGNPTPHPALSVERLAQTEIRKWVMEYGTIERD